jgi:predicted transcriptional regulator
MSNYTEQQTEAMISAYILDPTRETVDKLAEELGRSTKSIIGKLSREGVYRREVYVSKTGESPVTKVEIVNNICEDLGIEVASLAGLEKSPKTALRNLEKAVAGLTASFENSEYPGGL